MYSEHTGLCILSLQLCHWLCSLGLFGSVPPPRKGGITIRTYLTGVLWESTLVKPVEVLSLPPVVTRCVVGVSSAALLLVTVWMTAGAIGPLLPGDPPRAEAEAVARVPSPPLHDILSGCEVQDSDRHEVLLDQGFATTFSISVGFVGLFFPYIVLRNKLST